MKKLLLVVMLTVVTIGCTDQHGAEKALLDAGYTHVTMGGYAWFSCDEKDTFGTKFTAIGPTGRNVKGAVCSGLFKSQTIRLD